MTHAKYKIELRISNLKLTEKEAKLVRETLESSYTEACHILNEIEFARTIQALRSKPE